MAKRYSSPEKRDPLRNFNFRVIMRGREAAACRKMSGLTASVEVVKFRAGNSKSTADEMLPGRVTYEPITLEAGVTNDDTFKEWASHLVHHEASSHGRGTETDFRRDIEIHVYDVDNRAAAKKYIVYKAWVSKFTMLSELSADANEVLIQTLEIQHEGFSEKTEAV